MSTPINPLLARSVMTVDQHDDSRHTRGLLAQMTRRHRPRQAAAAAPTGRGRGMLSAWRSGSPARG